MSMDALSQNYAPRHSEPGHDTDRRIFDPELHRQPPPSSEIKTPEVLAKLERAADRERLLEEFSRLEAAHNPTPMPKVDDLPKQESGESYETVNHPWHYNVHPAGIECIDVIEAFPLNVGMVIKYLWRAGLKPGTTTLEDLQKARWYLDREIERQQNQEQRL